MSDDLDALGRTAEHYSTQWSRETGFKAFIDANPEAAQVMPGRQLGWSALFDRIRADGEARATTVYDAACGFGDIATQLLRNPRPTHLDYLGEDIHNALGDIGNIPQARFQRRDISSPPASARTFDYVICRAAIHHTAQPAETYKVLARQVAPGGTLAISAYARKAPMREATDDALRAKIVPLSNADAMTAARQFTQLGRDLQESVGRIVISQDLPLLGIKAGDYPIQAFIYDHFIKCWHNARFSEAHSDLVNFDWYHPPYAYRYAMSELEQWAKDCGLIVVNQTSIAAQHYLETKRLG